MNEEAPRHTFSDVDASGRADIVQRQLQVQAERTAGERERRFASLGVRPGDRVLDVGCGLGEVAAMFADLVGPTGSVVGLDASQAMVTQASAATAHLDQVSIRVGDAGALDLPDDTFDIVHSERVFMHLEAPEDAVAEAVRVTKPGGRVVLVDPDHSMTRVAVGDVEAASSVFWSLATWLMKNPRSGTRLIGQLRLAGLAAIEVSGYVSVYTEPLADAANFVESLRGAAQRAVEQGTLTQDRADDAVADIAKSLVDGTYLMLVPMITATGTKPRTSSTSPTS